MRIRIVAAAAFAALFLQPAFAAPGLADKVYSPVVNRGQAELEARLGRLNGDADDGEFASRFEAGYGLTDWWAAALVFEAEREPSGSYQAEEFEFENVFELPTLPGVPATFGVYAAYETSLQGGNDMVELRLLGEHESGPFLLRGNVIFERAFENGADAEYKYGTLAAYELSDDFKIGAEAFGGLSEDEHFVGPVVLFDIEPEGMPGELEVEAGYLFGFGGAAEANGQARLLLEWEFPL